MPRATLEHIERLADQIPPTEQLKLVAHICERLSNTQIAEQRGQGRLAQVEAWLAECDAVAASIKGTFDSADDIREIREERANCL